jgi:hypothetical protein
MEAAQGLGLTSVLDHNLVLGTFRVKLVTILTLPFVQLGLSRNNGMLLNHDTA